MASNNGYTIDEIITIMDKEINDSSCKKSTIEQCIYVYNHLHTRILSITSHPIITGEIVTILKKLTTNKSEKLMEEFITACKNNIAKMDHQTSVDELIDAIVTIRKRIDCESLRPVVEFIRSQQLKQKYDKEELIEKSVMRFRDVVVQIIDDVADPKSI